jgi:bacteriocin biosynthesis cyclodehydratase domain-containing protein
MGISTAMIISTCSVTDSAASLYARRDVGAAKVAASANWLHAFDPTITVRTMGERIAAPADVAAAIAGVDAVVLAADWPPYEIARWVNDACIDARIPFIVAGQLPPVLKIGPTYVPGEGACFTCHETAVAAASHSYEDYVAHRMSEPAMGSTLGPASCVIGGLIGLELLHLLTGHRPITQDGALLVNLRTLEIQREPIVRDPACAACKHLE